MKLTMRYRSGRWIVHRGKRLTEATFVASSECKFGLGELVWEWQRKTGVESVIVRVKAEK